jgi:hypothetical protein
MFIEEYLDDQNGFVGKSCKRIGMKGNPLAQEGYRTLLTEFRSFSRVIYGLSECLERFMMYPQTTGGFTIIGWDANGIRMFPCKPRAILANHQTIWTSKQERPCCI